MVLMTKHSENLQEQLINQAEQLFEQEKYQEALAIGEELMKNYPDEMMSLYVRGRARWGTKDYDGALADLDKAISIDSSFPLNHFCRGNVLYGLNRYEDAIECYNRVIELNPEYAIAYNNKGNSLHGLKRYEEAIECYNRAIELNPNNADAYYNKGNSLHGLQRYEEAIECYDRVTELNPEYTLAYNNKGNSLHGLKRYEEAIEYYNRVIELNPEYVYAYNNKGVSLQDLKRYEEALVCFNKALILDADYLLALKNKARLKEEMHRLEDALADYEKYLNNKPDDAHASFLYKQLQQKIKKLSTSSTHTQILPGLPDDEILQANKQIEEEAKEDNVEKAAHKKLKEIARDVVKRFRAEENPQINIDITPTFELDVPLEELEDLMNKLYENNKEHEHLEDRVNESNTLFKQFTSTGRSPEIEQPEFYVLRRWNSYTPIVADDNTNSKGGGYFIHLGEHGIVIDPGFNFIENFKKHGFKFNQISEIYISHAHNDHTADLESIRTLLYIYNKDLKKDIFKDLEKTVLEMNYPNQESMNKEELYKAVKAEWAERYKNQRKVIDIYLTASTFKKYATDLKLSENNEYRIHLINADSPPPDEDDSKQKRLVKIHPIPAKHNDLLSDCDAVGFAIEFPDLVLIYTGDTCFNWEIGRKYYELSNEFKDKKHGIALLAHIGGFKEWERDRSENRILKGAAFYENHLGRNGLICLTAHLKPKFCILSEFGEEFRGTREDLASQFSKVFEEKKISFIPADTGLRMRADGKLWVINSFINGKIERGFEPATNVGAISSHDATELIYCSKTIAAKYKGRWEIEAALKKDNSSHRPG